MANEIHIDYDSGNTLYAIIRNSSGQVNIVAGATFEDYTAANIANYVITLTENGDGGGRYVGSFNANLNVAGRYTIQVFLQAGASPADGDSLVGGGEIVWNGSAEEYVVDTNGRVDVGLIEGVDATDQINAACDTALSDINLDHLIQTSGTVTDDDYPTTTYFWTDLTKADDYFNDMIIVFTSGTLAGQARRISDFANTGGKITVDPPFTLVVGVDATFVIISGSFLQTNVGLIASSASAVTKLSKSADTMLTGTVDDSVFTSTTTEFEVSDITEATQNHYNDRVIIWLTGNLAEQAVSIADYSLSGGKGHFTVSAMTEAPANGDTFIIV